METPLFSLRLERPVDPAPKPAECYAALAVEVNRLRVRNRELEIMLGYSPPEIGPVPIE